jgi:hypothetical protein
MTEALEPSLTSYCPVVRSTKSAYSYGKRQESGGPSGMALKLLAVLQKHGLNLLA